MRHALRLLPGYLIAGCCLGWVLYHVHPGQLLHSLGHLNWYLVAGAILSESVNYVFQGLRWGLLLRPIARVRNLRAIQAVYAGSFANEVLPMRLGEFVRAYLMARWHSTRVSGIFPSMMVERLFDGIWLALGMTLVSLVVRLPPYLSAGARLFGFVIIVLAATLLYVVFRAKKKYEDATVHTEDRKLTSRVKHFVRELSCGLQTIGLSAMFYLALVVSLASLMMQIVALWLAIRACQLPLSFWQAAVVLLIMRLGVVIPSAPANIGTYQFFVALGLETCGVDRPVANGFSLVVFLLLSTSVWMIGSFALNRSGMSLFQLRHEIGHSTRIRS